MSNISELAAICFNISKSCMGAGFYAYPEMFNLYGVSMTFVMTVLSGIASVLGAFVYVDLNSRYKKENSISTLGKIIIGKKFRFLIDTVVILKCMIVGAVYLNKARDLIKKVPFENYVSVFKITNDKISYILVFLGCITFTPSILSVKLGKIKNLSYIGTAGIILIIIFSMIQAKDKKLNIEMKTENKNILKSIGPFVFGFSCHQSIMSIQNESNIPEGLLKFLISISFIFVGSLYTIFGLINSAAFSTLPDGSKRSLSDVFDAWDEDSVLRKIANPLFAFVLLITMPFQLHPAKTYFVELFNIKKEKNRSIIGISMILICYFLTTQDWYSFEFVTNYLSKGFNSLLCFGFPIIFSICDDQKKSVYSYFMIFYLSIFLAACLMSYYFQRSK